MINLVTNARMKMWQALPETISERVKCLFDTDSYSSPEMQPRLLLKSRINHEQTAVIII